MHYAGELELTTPREGREPGRSHCVRARLLRRLTALAAVRVGNTAAPMEATGIEQPASAARDALGIAPSAFPALLLLIAVVGLSVILKIMSEPASRGFLAFQPAAPAAFQCLPAVARLARLAEVARARCEQPFTVAHGSSRLQDSTGNHRRHRHRCVRMRGSSLSALAWSEARPGSRNG